MASDHGPDRTEPSVSDLTPLDARRVRSCVDRQGGGVLLRRRSPSTSLETGHQFCSARSCQPQRECLIFGVTGCCLALVDQTTCRHGCPILGAERERANRRHVRSDAVTIANSTLLTCGNTVDQRCRRRVHQVVVLDITHVGAHGSEQHLLGAWDAGRGRPLDGRLDLPQAGALSERGQDRVPDRHCPAARAAAIGKR
jgi:hypothetical protein